MNSIEFLCNHGLKRLSHWVSSFIHIILSNGDLHREFAVSHAHLLQQFFGFRLITVLPAIWHCDTQQCEVKQSTLLFESMLPRYVHQIAQHDIMTDNVQSPFEADHDFIPILADICLSEVVHKTLTVLPVSVLKYNCNLYPVLPFDALGRDVQDTPQSFLGVAGLFSQIH